MSLLRVWFVDGHGTEKMGEYSYIPRFALRASGPILLHQTYL